MKSFVKPDPWKIVEDSYDPANQKISESLCSIGNGRFGQRANFEETYSGPQLAGSYIAGVYYPDKTRVGWWKNGYPEYFAKVLNAPNWIGLHIEINGITLDLEQWEVVEFHRELDMKEGLLSRSATVRHPSGILASIKSIRMCHYSRKDLAAVQYTIKLISGAENLHLASYLDGDVRNEDSNYDEQFWDQYETEIIDGTAALSTSTKKTSFRVGYALRNNFVLNGNQIDTLEDLIEIKKVSQSVKVSIRSGDEMLIEKYIGIKSSRYEELEDIKSEARYEAEQAFADGFSNIKEEHIAAWAEKWKAADVQIEGDVKAQQGIRFNIFQLYQTYTGDDPRLNIGPKGFTGEKYGGSTYWDTEAYCLPFYMSTANQSIGRNLLVYRHRHLPQAIDNARKLGFSAGAALYPMVTMNGEECHNEWEITFEEIHRNGAIAFAIFDYVRYTDDHSYLVDYGAEVLIGIARFWSQRVHWSQPKERYVIHGVTGPNEYENNINNNWHTNYIARWCLNYAAEILQPNVPEALQPVIEKTRVTKEEVNHWISIAGKLYLPSDPETGLIMQQEGFLDKDIRPAKEIAKTEIPINQHWSWDRILRSCYIKQADVLQGLYFFEDDFTRDTIEKNFMFYEPLTVHESSLSPCVHSILASVIGQHESAYQMYLRTARLDLDDYNNDTEDGCHITSMAGTWMAIVKGFAGMRIRDNRLSFRPHCPAQWQSFRFQITWRKNLLTVQVDDQKLEIENRGPDLTFYLVDDLISLSENQKAKYDI